MNIQRILSSLETYNIEILLALLGLVALLLLVNIIGQIRLGKISKKYNRLLRGSQSDNLETLLFNIKDELGQIKTDISIRDEQLATIQADLAVSLQKKGLIRYNALDELGSNQSYSLALLDKGHNGFVLTSLYGRDFNASYIKPIKVGKSDYKLSKEEEEALRLALEN